MIINTDNRLNYRLSRQKMYAMLNCISTIQIEYSDCNTASTHALCFDFCLIFYDGLKLKSKYSIHTERVAIWSTQNIVVYSRLLNAASSRLKCASHACVNSSLIFTVDGVERQDLWSKILNTVARQNFTRCRL